MNTQELSVEYEFLPSQDNALRLQKAYYLIFEKLEDHEKEKEMGGQNNDK